MTTEHVWLTSREAAHYLRCSRNTLAVWVKRGLPCYSAGRKRVFWREDLDVWMKQHPGGGTNLTNGSGSSPEFNPFSHNHTAAGDSNEVK